MSGTLRWNPPGLAPPVGRYSHLARPGTDTALVYFSGQIGNLPDGTIVAGVEAQTLQVFRNIETLLAAVGATPADLVRLLTFVAGAENLPGFYAARDGVFRTWFPSAADYPGHSLAVVVALAAPDLVVEIEGWIAVPPEREPTP
jgi:2-iminobutanoate/2-iminopropanoate deaminase